jgi:cysteate synthase
VRRILKEANGPICYESSGLGGYLKLDNLFIAFNGYWPEKGAHLESGSFKELEANAVCARVPAGESRRMVVSSAGNTGMAFLQVCSQNDVPVVVVVPESAIGNLWTTRERSPLTTVAVLAGNVDYLDVIEAGKKMAGMETFYPEGGALNVARRDGMGTVLLSAVEHIGEIPSHYFQAVGSGTGGIAAWEMSLRLREDGRFGRHAKMKLHFVQNSPFTIMTDAWHMSLPELPAVDERVSREQISSLYAQVLSNRKPPYSIKGGVYDALIDTHGDMYSVSMKEAEEAGELFLKLEGIDLHPAAQVALAGLIQAARAGRIRRRESVLLNVTGGGSERLSREGKKREVKPDVVIRPGDNIEEIVTRNLVRI